MTKQLFFSFVILLFTSGTVLGQDRVDTMKKAVLDAVATGNATAEQKEIAKFLMDLSDYADLSKASVERGILVTPAAEIKSLRDRYNILLASEKVIPFLQEGKLLANTINPLNVSLLSSNSIYSNSEQVGLRNAHFLGDSSIAEPNRAFLKIVSEDLQKGAVSVESLADQRMAILKELLRAGNTDAIEEAKRIGTEISQRAATNNTLRNALKACATELPSTDRAALLQELSKGSSYQTGKLAKILKIGAGAMVIVGGAFFVTEAYNGNKSAWKKVEMASIDFDSFLKDSKCETKSSESKKILDESNAPVQHGL